ncbi:hypothetical protein SLNSH_23525 [Alsobacter soli]|uniref:Uncharacterized protein n=1 Tax=Alsobacter soli TaxID=2109933 RepID=A0A2T1HLL5_9HYPH|nr:hypothetical protein [Alsobacter soli]PSC02545.1 hypothetical protein SLNSH_23525 [Alsobacter soli]
MTVRDHNNRSEKQKGHEPVLQKEANSNPASQGHQGFRGATQDRSGADERHDGQSRQNGGGDRAGGAPRVQHQGGHPSHHDGGPGQHNSKR